MVANNLDLYKKVLCVSSANHMYKFTCLMHFCITSACWNSNCLLHQLEFIPKFIVWGASCLFIFLFLSILNCGEFLYSLITHTHTHTQKKKFKIKTNEQKSFHQRYFEFYTIFCPDIKTGYLFINILYFKQQISTGYTKHKTKTYGLFVIRTQTK